jgi:hypothetical protein
MLLSPCPEFALEINVKWEALVMNLKLYGMAVAAVAAGILAFGGTQRAFAACTDDIAAAQAQLDQKHDATKKQKLQTEQELKAAKAAAQAHDEAACRKHVNKARDHIKSGGSVS